MEHSEHTKYLSINFTSYRCISWFPKQLQWQHQRSLITDHFNKHNNEKVRNAVKVTKMRQTQSKQMCWNGGSARLIWQRVTTNLQFIYIKKVASVKYNKVKYNQSSSCIKLWLKWDRICSCYNCEHFLIALFRINIMVPFKHTHQIPFGFWPLVYSGMLVLLLASLQFT